MASEPDLADQQNDIARELLARAQRGRDEMLKSMELMREMQMGSTRDALGLMDHVREALDDARTMTSEGAPDGNRASPGLADTRIDTLERSMALVAERLKLAQLAVESAQLAVESAVALTEAVISGLPTEN